MDDFSKVDFSKLSTEQMDALLNRDPLPASQQAIFPSATFESSASGSGEDATQFMDELFDFGPTGSDPMLANLGDYDPNGTASGQLHKDLPFGVDLLSNHSNGLDLFEDNGPQNNLSWQIVDARMNPFDQSDFSTNLRSFSGRQQDLDPWAVNNTFIDQPYQPSQSCESSQAAPAQSNVAPKGNWSVLFFFRLTLVGRTLRCWAMMMTLLELIIRLRHGRGLWKRAPPGYLMVTYNTHPQTYGGVPCPLAMVCNSPQ